MDAKPLDIAVIGMGCRFPGADSPEAFYRNLLANRGSVGEIPPERWSHAGLYGLPGGIDSKWGGFLPGIDAFDARFFRIVPSEAETLDPQQKLFLECSWEAMEDAGYARRQSTAGKPIGVYAGVTWSEFSLLANEYGYLQDRYRGPGALLWGIPNRVSYFFDWTGPSIAIDTACSSSLAAVHMAAMALRAGDCDMALAGGVNLNLHPAKYLFLSHSNFLSREGKCRAFGEGGSGYVPSEGVGAVVLKRLADAEADGDRIYGVIKATSANHGGKATGYTVPNPRAQAELVKAALRRSGLDARDLSYLECHGTGTDLGDPIEIAGLRMAFADSTRDQGFCGIGSVKSNIGHCEAAAGVAGLIKVLMSMRGGTLPATLHAREPNRKIPFAGSPFYLVQENRPWTPGPAPLAAGVGSFGAGGSNGYCIVQSYAEGVRRPGTAAGGRAWLPISTRSPDRTRELAMRLENRLSERPGIKLADLERTLRAREEFEHRVAIEAGSTAEFLDGLRRWLASPEALLVPAGSPGPETPAAALRREEVRRWAEGGRSHTDWPAAAGSLISLPHYPFERTRSWIDASPTLYRKPELRRPIHPLLDRNESTARRGLFPKTLHRDEYFVAEHFVGGHPVLPGVCHLEMISRAAQEYLEAPAARLTDIWFLEPVNLRETERMGLLAEIRTGEGAPRFQIASEGGRVQHSAGRVAAEAGPVPERIEAGALWERCRSEMGPEACYDLFREKGIEQHGRFRVLAGLRYDGTVAIARLSLARAFAGDAAYGFNPTLLDGAVQTAMIHLHATSPDAGMVLPFQIGAYARHGSTPQTAYAVATLQSAQARRYHLAVTDESGNVLAEFRDFVLKEYRPRREDARLLVFNSGMQPCPPARAGDELPENAPVCLLAHGADPGAPGLPASWKRIEWPARAAFPSAEVSAWLAGAEGGVPRIVIPIANIASQGTGTYPQLRAAAERLTQGMRILAQAGRPLECIAFMERPEGASQPLAWACAALFRTLNLELAQVRARLVEIALPAGADPAMSRRALMEEIGAGNAETHVQYRRGRRHAPKPAAIAAAESRAEGPDAWAVTGAGGALGFQAALELLRSGRRVTLIGRSPLPAEKRDALSAFPAAQWEYVQADLTDPGQAAAAGAKASAGSQGGLGIVHCAGTLDDGAFLRKEWPALEGVIAAKAGSLLNLAAALPEGRLRRLVLYSSVTALFGNRGQSGYAFANGFLDGYAAAAAESGVRSVSIDWPYWEQGGMRIAEEHLAAYAETFLTRPLPMREGILALAAAMGGAETHVGVAFTGARIAELSAKTAMKPLPRVEEPSAAERMAASPAGASDPEGKREAIRGFVLRFLEDELKLTLGDGDLHTRLADMGVDSIAQMDLIAKLEKSNRFRSVPQSLLEEHNSVAALVEFFFSHHLDADYGT